MNSNKIQNYNIFCTIFNSLYIDKALVMVDSLLKCAPNFKLYIFAMDDKTCEVLLKINCPSLIVVNVNLLENDMLLKLKSERSFAEYCWTWTPLSIRYVLSNYNENICTYIDADMFFYQNPEVLIKEMLEHKADILLVKHNFPRDNLSAAEHAGTFCVEFNTFLNNENGMKSLDKWCEQCIEECSFSFKVKKTHGDQKYLENWPKEYPWVHILENIGGGVAPWNNMRYSFSFDENIVYLNDLEGTASSQLVFYHFQNIRFLPFGFVNIGLVKKNNFVRNYIYKDYLYRINEKRRTLKKEFGVKFSFKKATYRNKILRFIQNYIMPFRFRQISSLMRKKGKKIFE